MGAPTTATEDVEAVVPSGVASRRVAMVVATLKPAFFAMCVARKVIRPTAAAKGSIILF